MATLAVGALEDIDFERPLHQFRESKPPPTLVVRDLRKTVRFASLTLGEYAAEAGTGNHVRLL